MSPRGHLGRVRQVSEKRMAEAGHGSHSTPRQARQKGPDAWTLPDGHGEHFVDPDFENDDSGHGRQSVRSLTADVSVKVLAGHCRHFGALM